MPHESASVIISYDEEMLYHVAFMYK